MFKNRRSMAIICLVCIAAMILPVIVCLKTEDGNSKTEFTVMAKAEEFTNDNEEQTDTIVEKEIYVMKRFPEDILIIDVEWAKEYMAEIKAKEAEEARKAEEVRKAASSAKTVSGTSAASYVWNYLANCGYNAYAISGILGSMMAETGGQTLNLQPYIYGYYAGRTYYGLCMWDTIYFPNISGLGIDGQLAFLVKDLARKFPNLKNAPDIYTAAYNFSVYYEKGGGTSVRIRNAYTAYNYFM